MNASKPVTSISPKPLCKALLRKMGIDVRLTRSTGCVGVQVQKAAERPGPALPPLFEDPLQALHYCRGGKPAAFHCPIDACVTITGLNFSSTGWHPFSATLEELTTRAPEYASSTLERYYNTWHPSSAREALIDRRVAPHSFAELPAHFIYFFPWSSRTLSEADSAVRQWTQDDNLEHHGPLLRDIQTELKDHGPITPEVGRFEYQRLTSLFFEIRQNKFRREHGDIRVVILKRGHELRFLNFGGGLHRTAVMKALGATYIPARPLNQLLIDVDDVDYWPQVRSGRWPKPQALRYIDHLFDFDARSWARDLGLSLH